MRAPVTDHAVIRYCQRVLDVEAPPAKTNAERAALCAELLGLGLDALRALVCPPAYWGAVLAGAVTIRTQTHIMKCGDSRSVVTVYEKRRTRAGRVKIHSERENRKERQRSYRRRKGRAN